MRTATDQNDNDVFGLTLCFRRQGFEACKLFFKSFPKSSATICGEQNYRNTLFILLYRNIKYSDITDKLSVQINKFEGQNSLGHNHLGRNFFQTILVPFTLHAKHQIFQ